MIYATKYETLIIFFLFSISRRFKEGWFELKQITCCTDSSWITHNTHMEFPPSAKPSTAIDSNSHKKTIEIIVEINLKFRIQLLLELKQLLNIFNFLNI